MEKILNKIAISSTNSRIDSILKSEKGESRYTYHYNHNEESFVKLDSEFTMPHFPVHHNSDLTVPGKAYIEALEKLLHQVVPKTGSLFSNLKYYFDKSEIFHPCFYRVYKYKEQRYLNLLRLDLSFKPSDCTIVKSGSNDLTDAFRTRKLYLESDLIPIADYSTSNGKIDGFLVEQNVSETWIGESGRGYLLEGIWIDQELTKFLSRLLLPDNKKTYPYYPFTCKHRTLCHTVTDLSPNGRKKHLIYLHNARIFILPLLDEIQNALKESTKFSKDIPAFISMKKKVPPFWNNIWDSLRVETYLNEQDMKEFLVEF